VIPYTVFISPELGRIGFTETEARARGHRLRVAKIPSAAAIPRAKTLHMAIGTRKAVVDADSEEILGVTILGHEAGK
jgi:pyruvate/2-oxoglutarate dehydrogenase complex dihydrolipoamide dehydrogenase (E3) component